MIYELNKCFLYGAGINAYGVLKYLGKDRVAGIIDSNIDKIGNRFGQYTVIDLNEYKKKFRDYPIVISAYQKNDEVIETLNNEEINNYYISFYLQSNVTEVTEIVDYILKKSVGKKICFDDTINVIVPLIIEELRDRGKDSLIGGVVKSSNRTVMENYNLSYVNEDTDMYLVSTEIGRNNKNIINLSSGLDLCNLMYYNPKYQNLDLLKFKDCHKGQRCFIIGNGPSLRIEDLEKLNENNEICFGSNGIFYVYNETDWRPNYYTVTDYVRYRELYDKIEDIPSIKMFFRKFYNMENMNYMKNAYVYNSPPQRGFFEFSEDITRAVYSGQSVTYNMLQIAAYMGFKEIYLLGVDFSFNNVNNHFTTKYDEELKDKGIFYKNEGLMAFEAAERYSRNHGFRILNATRGGALEVFERVDFDSLF